MEEPQSLQELNELFWQGIELYKEDREDEIAPQVWEIMQRVCKDINKGLSRKKIQEHCSLTVGWFPSQQQISALRTVINSKLSDEPTPGSGFVW
jgi:hypothetical protein